MGESRLDKVLDRIDDTQRGNRALAFVFGVVKKFGDDRGGELAALIAYYAFFSLFPLLLLFVTLLGYALQGNDRLRAHVLNSALSEVPVLGQDLARNVGSLSGSPVAVTVGLVGALWGGLGVASAAQNAMNEVWDVPRRERPGFFPRLLRSVEVLVILGLGVTATTFVGQMPRLLPDAGTVAPIAFTILSVALNALLAMVAFRVLTRRRLTRAEMWPGALVAGVAYTVLQLVGGWYINRVVRGAGDTYGTFAAVIGLLTWFYLVAQVSVLAAEVNVVRAGHLWPRSLTGRRITDADRRVEQLARAQEVRLTIDEAALETDVHAR